VDGKITVKYLQKYIRSNDYSPELKERYFMKLVEEVGELSRAMRKNLRSSNEDDIKETVDEELGRVLILLDKFAEVCSADKLHIKVGFTWSQSL